MWVRSSIAAHLRTDLFPSSHCAHSRPHVERVGDSPSMPRASLGTSNDVALPSAQGVRTVLPPSVSTSTLEEVRASIMVPHDVGQGNDVLPSHKFGLVRDVLNVNTTLQVADDRNMVRIHVKRVTAFSPEDREVARSSLALLE